MFVTQKQLLQLAMFRKLAIEQESSNYPSLRSRSRKRKQNEKLWKRNIQKTARNSGKEYVNSRNKKVKERRINYHRCGNCVNHCNQRLPDARRDELFHDYWKLGEWQRQRDYIANHVMRKQTKRNTNKDSRRKQTFSYFFTINDQKIKVCKTVFLKTLGIGEKIVSHTLEHQVGMVHA